MGGAEDTLLVGTSSGHLVAISLSSKALPHRVLVQPFSLGEGISALWAGPSSGATPKWRVAIGGGKGSVGIYAFANDDTTASVEKLKVVDRAHRGSVQSVCSADGKHFVSGAADETTMVWELSQQLPVREMPNSLYCAVTAHQLVFGAGTQGNVKVITSTTCRTEK
jgi:WD40 repeat protein